MSTATATLALELPPEVVERIAAQVADRLSERFAEAAPASAVEGYMPPKAAANYLGVSRKRIYDLRSSGALEPDGYDGRTPLFTRKTLDRYVRSRRP